MLRGGGLLVVQSLILSSSALFAQDLQNAEFNSISGWTVDGGRAVVEEGRLHIFAGERTRVSQRTMVRRGEYQISADIQSADCSGVALLYGKGEGFTPASALIPKSGYAPSSAVVKGLRSEDGWLEVGFESDGSRDIFIDNVKLQPQSKPFLFGQGGDITELNYVLASGGNFFDEEGRELYQPSDPLEVKARGVVGYLRRMGMDMVRIRLSNNPGKAQPDLSNTYFLPDGFQDERDCLLLAELAHEAGMKIQFTFNYSDYWSNGERQNIPADWMEQIAWMSDANDIVRKLSQLLGGYTKRIMQELASRGIFPEYVSLGNEINGGMLFPYGYSYDVKPDFVTQDMPAGRANWEAIASFINAGYEAVKSVSPQSKVVVHLADQTGDFGKYGASVGSYTYSWFLGELERHGGKYDVIGASYYPSWSRSTVDDMVGYCNNLIRKFDKDILVMESGYNWNATRKDGYPGQLNQNAEAYRQKYPDSPIGQKGYLAELLNGLKWVGEGTDRQCVGLLYWDPVMIHVEDEWGKNKTGWAHFVQWDTPDANVVENTTLFDFEGKALPALDVFRLNCVSREETVPDDTNLAEFSSSSLRVVPQKGGLLLFAREARSVAVCGLGGVGRLFDMEAGEVRFLSLAKGVYVVNGEMVLVK